MDKEERRMNDMKITAKEILAEIAGAIVFVLVFSLTMLLLSVL